MSLPMNATDPVITIELASLLVPHGEDRVSLRYNEEAVLELTIIVEDDSGGAVSQELVIAFDRPVMHYFAAVPGPDNLNININFGDGKRMLGNVLEFQRSDAADAWSKHFGWKLRHFHVYFFNENMRLDVIAKSCERAR